MKNPLHNTDKYLIIGQGIAGTMLSYFLHLRAVDFKVINQLLPGATSKIAAGLMNPITGRRLVKSWRYEALSAFAKDSYLHLSQLLKKQYLEEKSILKALHTVFDENEWLRRSAFPENLPYFKDQADLETYQSIVQATFGWGEIQGAAKINLASLVDDWSEFLLQKNRIQNEVFNFELLELKSNHVRYKGVKYQKVIFCEGSQALKNPFFNFLPFAFTKGELFIVRIPGFSATKILKNKIYLIPLGNELFWVGSTNQFTFENTAPTKDQWNSLHHSLKEAIHVPFEILSHHAGIRPTIKDKRPILGPHPEFSPLYIFNGLGTKGASLAPLFAHQLCEHLLDGRPIDDSVHIRRFQHMS